MKPKWGIGFIFLVLFSSLKADVNYYWPLVNPVGYVEERRVSSNFCDYRSGHFHEGIDIPTNIQMDVYSATDKFKVLEIFPLEAGWEVRIQHYDDSGNPLEEGSVYLHMFDYNRELLVGSTYTDEKIAIKQWFEANHLHFEFRTPGTLSNSINPFVVSVAFEPEDEYDPKLKYLYVDHSQMGDATVEKWNLLSYNFDSYYNESSEPPFKMLTISETPDNDLDDPHILINGNRKVRFVLEENDEITEPPIEGTSGCAPYFIMFFLDFDKPPAEISDSDSSAAYYAVRFDSLMYSGDEVHQEEDVYHTEYPLVSDPDFTVQYYRLYPYDYSPPSCVISQNKELKTESLDDGSYRIRVFVRDYGGRKKTADVHFYIKNNDWVDYCRGFSQ